MRIDVALTPAEPLPPAAVVIVVDVVRATTTALFALAQGYERVLCVGEVEEAVSLAAGLGRSAVLAGERECLPIDGFALGNSPAAFATGEPLGETLVLTTTNGTRAVLRALAEAPIVLAGALVNLSACAADAAAAVRAPAGGIGIRCAGLSGGVALDDAYAAGRLVEALATALPAWQLGDAARLARAAATAYPSPREAIGASRSARDVKAAGLVADLDDCARVDALPLVARATPAGAAAALRLA